MAENVVERADERIAESVRKISRTTSAVAEAIESGMAAAKRLGRRGSDAAEEFIDDATLRMKRHPVGTTIAAFALGFITGALTYCLLSTALGPSGPTERRHAF